jgi:hypothetical protein
VHIASASNDSAILFGRTLYVDSVRNISLLPIRFHLRAQESIHFPPNKAANVVRGGFGTVLRQIACHADCQDTKKCPNREICPYAEVFEPKKTVGPSGLADLPRPFLFRARHLDGVTIARSAEFYFDVHLFDYRPIIVAYFVAAFRELATSGMGPRRGSAELVRVTGVTADGNPSGPIYDGSRLAETLPAALVLSLEPALPEISRVVIKFLSPIELNKHHAFNEPPRFRDLIGRIRDRIGNLRLLYGDGPLAIDFRALGERAEHIKVLSAQIQSASVERQSSRTHQRHSIGGFIGHVEYEGALAEFLPYLEAARWTGAGRHAVWGNGEIEVVAG